MLSWRTCPTISCFKLTTSNTFVGTEQCRGLGYVHSTTILTQCVYSEFTGTGETIFARSFTMLHRANTSACHSERKSLRSLTDRNINLCKLVHMYEHQGGCSTCKQGAGRCTEPWFSDRENDIYICRTPKARLQQNVLVAP